MPVYSMTHNIIINHMKKKKNSIRSSQILTPEKKTSPKLVGNISTVPKKSVTYS